MAVPYGAIPDAQNLQNVVEKLWVSSLLSQHDVGCKHLGLAGIQRQLQYNQEYLGNLREQMDVHQESSLCFAGMIVKDYASIQGCYSGQQGSIVEWETVKTEPKGTNTHLNQTHQVCQVVGLIWVGIQVGMTVPYLFLPSIPLFPLSVSLLPSSHLLHLQVSHYFLLF